MSNKTLKFVGLAALLFTTANALSAIDAGAGQQDLRLQTKPGTVKPLQVKPQQVKPQQVKPRLQAAPPAKSEQIACPLYNVKLEMVTALPQNWWYTPTTKSVSELKVTTVAGKTTLACIYGKPDDRRPSLMRHPPAGLPNCVANNAQKVFVCTSIK